MKSLLMSLVFTLGLSTAAFAKTPPEIMKPYKEYRSALKAGDAHRAREHSYEAWQQAEKLLGDSKLTGDLAQNFADIRSDEKDKNRADAFERSMELASYYGEEAPITWLDRSIRLGNYYKSYGDWRKMFSTAKDIAKYAEENGLTNSTFYGEALTLKTEWYVRRGDHEKTEETSEAAMQAFESATDGVVSIQPLMATLYSGFGEEGQGNVMDAALEYQKVMEAIDGKLDQDHPLSAQALGRWSHMRSRLSAEGLLEEAEQKGLCQCWPYDKPRNEALKPIKRVPPKMPRDAYVSGYSIVEFDLDDAGKIINPEILISWPKDIYEEASLESLEEWEYTPRVEGETQADREDLITTIRYRLSDSSGNILY